MARAVQRRGFRARPRQTQMAWNRLVDLSNTITAPSTKLLVNTFGPTAGFDLTVRRMRGLFSIRSDQDAVSEQQSGVLGAIVANEEATTAGVASVPGPVSDPDAHWLMWEPFSQRDLFVTAAGFERNSLNVVTFDVKAMRILQGTGNEQLLAFVLETDSASEGIIVNLYLSLLNSVRGTAR